MLTELLQDRASLYVSGLLTETERESFEILLEYHRELQALVADLRDTTAALVLGRAPSAGPMPAGLKDRILSSVAGRPQQREPDALVVTDAEGRVEWINPAFTHLCGYSLGELQGHKPGRLLQGPETDPATVDHIRSCLRAGQACQVNLVNYHKNGSRYVAELRISPFLDDDQRPIWFTARERKLAVH
jgi:PAS domain S-box-containing protein